MEVAGLVTSIFLLQNIFERMEALELIRIKDQVI